MNQKQRDAMNVAYYNLWIGEMHGIQTTDSLLQAAVHHDAHRWLYLSDQKPTEAFIFKQWDERPDQQHNPQAYHNSYRDPFHEANDDLPERKSVEFRTLLLFPKSESAVRAPAFDPLVASNPAVIP